MSNEKSIIKVIKLSDRKYVEVYDEMGAVRIKDTETDEYYDVVSGYKDNDNPIIDLLNDKYKEIQHLKKVNGFLLNHISKLISYLSELGFDVELEDDEGNIINLTDEVD